MNGNSVRSIWWSLLGLLLAATCQADPTRIPLWEAGAPGEPATKADDEPVLFLYQPPTGERVPTAVIVCPGGGYGHLSMEKEGSRIAEWLNSFGVTAFVLRYRHRGTGHMHPVPMFDGQRAIRLVRARTDEWGIAPERIGVIGFSAGGHLASTLGTHFDAGDPAAADPIDRVSSRPAFLILCYAVITMRSPSTHQGSRQNLLGDHPDEALVQLMSNDEQVTRETPPAFLFHTDADTGVPAENSVAFYSALRRAGVPAELHIYATGGHGVGLADAIPATRTWPDRCREWLITNGWARPTEP
jgi:acetyl esterase/lipase